MYTERIDKMAGTKQIRLGKVLNFIECLELELKINRDSTSKLAESNPAKQYFNGSIEQLEKTINDMKRWFSLNEEN